MMPSKKVWGILIIAISLVVFIILIFGKEKVGNAINFATTLTPGEKIKLPENPSWQAEINKSISIETATTTDNKTDTVATTLIYNYLALKQNNSLDKNSANDLIKKIEELASETTTKQITLADLDIIEKSDIENIKNYGETLGNILKTNKPEKLINELLIIQESFKNEDPQKIRELEQVIFIYEKISEQMLKMSVPSFFKEVHLDMVNGVLGITDGLKKIMETFNDPIAGLNGVGIYQNKAEQFIQALKAISLILKNQNITYKQGSGGYYLIYGI
jgi:hypothetical protein